MSLFFYLEEEMFALLDTKMGVKVLSDLILSYLPLRFIDYTNDDYIKALEGFDLSHFRGVRNASTYRIFCL